MWNTNSPIEGTDMKAVFSNRGPLLFPLVKSNIVEQIQHIVFCIYFVRNCILGSVIDFGIPNLKTTVVAFIIHIIVCMFQYSTRPGRIDKVCIFVMKPRIM